MGVFREVKKLLRRLSITPSIPNHPEQSQPPAGPDNVLPLPQGGDSVEDRPYDPELLHQLSREIEILKRHNAALEQIAMYSADDLPQSEHPPLVSIIIPTFNRANYILDAVQSVVRQTFQNWELIIVDDGSSDGTAEIVAPILSDPRIKFVQQPHAGHAAARNHGLRLSHGSIIAYLDSDCTWYPGFLAAMAAEFENDPDLDMAYGALVLEKHDDRELGHIMFEPFDRTKLLQHNYIDINVTAHRRHCFETMGGFDEKLSRLVDWDLVLRYTADKPGRPIPIVGAKYCVRDDMRVSSTEPLWLNHFRVVKKWYPASVRPLRVLYVMWHYPQLSESYIETEIRCMQRWGVHVEVWHNTDAVSPYPTSLKTHRGSLEEAISLAKPDVIQVHWLSFAIQQHETLAAANLPVTVRLHGFDVTAATLADLRARSWAKRIYAFPHQLKLADASDERMRNVYAAFDSTMFKPFSEKDPKLVVRTAACLASKDLPFFFQLAERLPDHRFVLAAVTCNGREDYVAHLRELHRSMNSKVELLFDAPREQMADLMAQAGIYVHTVQRPGPMDSTPVGMPISIAEAMATGAYVLVADLPEFVDYLGEAGAAYRDLDHATDIVASTADWSHKDWQKARMNSIERAFQFHVDEVALRVILDDWITLVADQPNPHSESVALAVGS